MRVPPARAACARAHLARCGYNRYMSVATSRLEVGVRDLKNNLSRYLDRVSQGDEIVVTDHGRPVARLLRVDRSTERLADLVASGLVRPPKAPARRLPTPVKTSGPVSDRVADQRR